jgi:hypothetical protein
LLKGTIKEVWEKLSEPERGAMRKALMDCFLTASIPVSARRRVRRDIYGNEL